MAEATGYMLDTNVFNHVLDGRIDAAHLTGRRLFATHIQLDEIRKTADLTRRQALLSVFSEITQEQQPTSTAVAGISVAGLACAGSSGVVPTESAVWGVSRWGQAKWGTRDNIFEAMRRDLDALNKRKRNNTYDVLIAETAFRNGWVLITADVDLFEIMTKYGGACANAHVFEV